MNIVLHIQLTPSSYQSAEDFDRAMIQLGLAGITELDETYARHNGYVAGTLSDDRIAEVAALSFVKSYAEDNETSLPLNAA